jgi:cytoskeletal protein RodZ
VFLRCVDARAADAFGYRSGDMLQPVGSLPPATYWRRRVAVAALVIGLAVLSWYVVFGGPSKSDGNAAPASHASSRSSSHSSPPSTSVASTTATPTARGARCTASTLTVAAATGKRIYKVGQAAALYLVITNSGTSSCVQDLADEQVELTVFTGDVRVWGSHDCQMQPGTAPQRLVPNKPVRVEVIWTGKTSQPGCGGTRLQVQPGTYRLYAALNGTKSTPVTFIVQ